MSVVDFIPRQHRDLARAHAAARRVEQSGGDAMEAAAASITAAFDQAAVINNLKFRVERWLCLGHAHSATRRRFGARSKMVADRVGPPRADGAALTISIILVERWLRDERKAFQIASALGYGNGRLSVEVLTDLRLILRWFRFKGLQSLFVEILREWE